LIIVLPSKLKSLPDRLCRSAVPALGENCYFRAMNDDLALRAAPPRAPSSDAAPVLRAIAESGDWSITEYICNAGPGDRRFEERHGSFTIAAVMAGLFRYRGATGTALLHPGAFLLGNFGASFECGHDHSRGDHCIAFHFRPGYFAEVAAVAGGTAGFKFKTAMLPSTPSTLSWLARMPSLTARGDALALDESLTELLALIVAAHSGHVSPPQRISASDERRISRALQVLQQEFAEAISLDQLAAAAGMSKYHFLRSFRRIVGTTPHQYLLSLRLRHAALRLAASPEAVSTIAFASGFGDLSTFNARFRRQFGATPSHYRARLRA
jgi:AraC-like DNA-binding protein